jgi:hypothetical protein
MDLTQGDRLEPIDAAELAPKPHLPIHIASGSLAAQDADDVTTMAWSQAMTRSRLRNWGTRQRWSWHGPSRWMCPSSAGALERLIKVRQHKSA